MKKKYLVAIILLGFSVYMGCKKDDETFSCGDTFIDSRDGQNYNTVLIGDQCWMAENLNIGTMINGTNDMTDDGVIEKYCYDNDSANCNEYGGLYQWNEMMEYDTTAGVQGICPDGWHLPTDDEWKILEGTVDSLHLVGDSIWNRIGFRGYDAGKNLKSKIGWFQNTGTDAFEFTALPGGCSIDDGYFYKITNSTLFWTSTENQGSAWNREVFYGVDKIGRGFHVPENGYSVRCLKN